jgi:glycine betaine catabolism B
MAVNHIKSQRQLTSGWKMNSAQFNKWLVIVNGSVPLLVLGWDTYYGQLGANSVNYALHVTGILSLVFLLLSLSITPLRWLTGWGGWIACRRALGLYGFFYAVLHVSIYVALDRELSIASTFREIWLRRFLQVGTVAVFLMLPLAITSTNAMIQKLGAKRWKQLHRLAYVVAALGIVHYYMLVKSDVRQPIAFGIVLTGLLGTRFGKHYFELRKTASLQARNPVSKTPATRRTQIWRGELSITSITPMTPDVKTFRLQPKDGGPLPFQHRPGQYMSLQLTIDGKRVNRSYTIASSPTLNGACELTIKRDPNGLASRYLHDHCKVGDVLKVTAPAGKFVFTGTEASSILMIAGGVGITPLMSVARYLAEKVWDGDIYFVVVARKESDIIFHDELRELSRRCPNLHLCITLTQVDANSSWPGHRGFISEQLLHNLVIDLKSVPIHLCGPTGMMDATRDLLIQCGVAAQQIKTEEFVSPRVTGHGVSGDVGTESNVSTEENQPPEEITSSAATSLSRIRFNRSNVEAEMDGDTTVLEAAEATAIELPFECRSGICGQCKTRLLSGTVVMDSEDALTAAEKAHGWILACQAHACANLVVDA